MSQVKNTLRRVEIGVIVGVVAVFVSVVGILISHIDSVRSRLSQPTNQAQAGSPTQHFATDAQSDSARSYTQTVKATPNTWRRNPHPERAPEPSSDVAPQENTPSAAPSPAPVSAQPPAVSAPAPARYDPIGTFRTAIATGSDDDKLEAAEQAMETAPPERKRTYLGIMWRTGNSALISLALRESLAQNRDLSIVFPPGAPDNDLTEALRGMNIGVLPSNTGTYGVKLGSGIGRQRGSMNVGSSQVSIQSFVPLGNDYPPIDIELTPDKNGNLVGTASARGLTTQVVVPII